MVLSLISYARLAESVDRTPNDQLISTAEAFVDAFYSFEPDTLQALLSSAEGSIPSILFYQGWAQGGSYEVIARMPCELESEWVISCSAESGPNFFFQAYKLWVVVPSRLAT